ncbi:hypothetical protein [Desulfosarcina ovata]|uniref:Antitoxin SocA-like Panacea domain-containing protein n=1 Tax=Desulfosarcina ovata subsp. ovata TaxID=2752305 RepID=A0A5K8AB07_9BACT|nr:hypothetical protein [Desulfosarcina ovata]BBO89777.1 hypothetical protein DSCOOX_29570 [Desulfosarcina ovata subsp. ovata]
MKEEQNRAVLLALIDSLREEGSWCGETHIQKAAFFLKKLTKVPIDFDFILYKHGPFSFDLSDELSVMKTYGLLELVSKYPYGPKLVRTGNGEALCNRSTKTIARYGKQIGFLSDKLGGKGVVDLERLATAYYVTLKTPDDGPEERAKAIVKLKPHISLDSAKQAVLEVDGFIAEVNEKQLAAA